MFDAQVQPGALYILVDDHVGLGGTLANLRGYVEARGGSAIAITTLTESRDAKRLSLTPETRNMLWEPHGEELDQFWQAKFGHGRSDPEAVRQGKLVLELHDELPNPERDDGPFDNPD